MPRTGSTQREPRDVPGFPYCFPTTGFWDKYNGPFPARLYQQEMIESVWQKLQSHDSTLVVSATGTGKAVAFGHLCRIWPRDMGRILVLVHRDELLHQAAKKIRAICPNDRVELECAGKHADRGTWRDGVQNYKSRIVVASKDTLWRESRLNSWHRGSFGLIIPDEAHHLTPAVKTWWKIISHFSNAYIVGFTATPDRTDKQALGQAFSSVAFQYPITQACQDGWLVPIVQKYVAVQDYDLSHVRTHAGDLSPGDLDIAMRHEKVLHGIVDPTIQLSNTVNRWGSKRSTLIFACSVKHAQTMAEIFNRHHASSGTGVAAWVAHEGMTMDDRREILQRFRQGEIRYLVNVMTLTEGTDLPDTRMVVIARPTKSRSLFEQMIGRGLRPCDAVVDDLNAAATVDERRSIIYNSPKPSALIVDPVGNSGKHKLVSTLDVLGGEYGQEIIDRAKKNLQTPGGPGLGDVLNELLKAQKQREKEEAERRKNLIIKTKFTTRNVDPFDKYDQTVDRNLGMKRTRPPTDKQTSFLQRIGTPLKQILRMTIDTARAFITDFMSRKKSGQCTPNQARVLERYGYSGDCTFDEAKKILDRLAASGWKDPEE